MSIDAKTVKALRDKTGCGFMDCKAALAESQGDIEAAVDYLRKKGMSAAAKKAHRDTGEGLIEAFILPDGKTGALVEVNCETDFVARTDDFKGLVSNLARQAAESGGSLADADAMLGTPYIADAGQTVEEALNATVGKIGENMRFRRVTRFACEGEGLVDAYIHPGSKIGVLIEVGCETADTAAADEFRSMVRDVAMQVAANAPQFLNAEAVPEEVVAKEKEILLEQARESGKPENVLEKIVEGRIRKYFEEVCLVEQKFIKDQDVTVKKFVDNTAGARGEKFTVRRFQRYQLGEE